MTNKLPISVIIIAKNEAHTLPRCLDSVRGWSSEIIAVINDCTDDTENVLKSYGAKVYHHDWQGFVIQKNRAIQYASYDWIFSIDADEEVTPKMQRDIQNIIEQNDTTISAVDFCRKTWFLGKWIKHGDWYPDRVIRLFRRNKAKYEGNFLHEKLVVDGKTKHSDSNLLHYSFPNLYIFLGKLDSFTRNFEKANLGKKRFSPVGSAFRSWWKFFRCYFIKLGFLDGYQGLLIAIHQGYSTFFKYSVLLENQVKANKPEFDKEDL